MLFCVFEFLFIFLKNILTILFLMKSNSKNKDDLRRINLQFMQILVRSITTNKSNIF